MNNQEIMIQDYKNYYLSEYSLYNGDRFITFNIIEINTEKNDITAAVSDEGRISVITFDLLSDNGRLYFEYGVMLERIAVDDFEKVREI